MLALVKKPHIEISLHGDCVAELVAWIRKKYDVAILAEDSEDEYISIESSTYWKEMENNRKFFTYPLLLRYSSPYEIYMY
jgi:hypothetical protein